MKTRAWILMNAIGLVAATATLLPARMAAEESAATPEEMVATYDSLANVILASKATEWNLVRSILAATFRRAEATFHVAKGKMERDENAQADIERLAALVSHLGNEGDAAVAAVRKRLLEGGHHHNAAGEKQGLFDEGFVIVTREAKKVFLEAAKAMGRLSFAPDPAGLEAQWKAVSLQYGTLFDK